MFLVCSPKGHRFLYDETVEDMLTPHGFRGGVPRYGYGWFVTPDDSRTYPPSSFGLGGGDGTAAHAYPDEDLLGVFITHSRDSQHLEALLAREQEDPRWVYIQVRLDDVTKELRSK